MAGVSRLRDELPDDRRDLARPPRHIRTSEIREQVGDTAHLLLLMAVAFLPFPTRLMAQAIRDGHAERAAVVFYGVSLFVITAVISALWASVVRDRELLKPE